MAKASPILAYSSRTLLKPSMRPVGLPCASWVWKTRRGRRPAGGGGNPCTGPAPPSPAPPSNPAAVNPARTGSASSFSTSGAFFLRLRPRGMVGALWSQRERSVRQYDPPSVRYGVSVSALCVSMTLRQCVMESA
ncbi:hypothetical protein JZ751_005517 [Albula glossodonta]|uniref:Uncharacterized protein n=1 Tax=Albula glossodonta TaxID=121402 RepID=A0A8T2MQB3_9TELE|nr:hypothetical protein JZ751_005517 [Albula glossodonta]